MKKLKIIYITLIVFLSVTVILRIFVFPSIDEEKWWLRNMISSRNFFDAFYIVLFGVVLIAIVYLLYKLLRYLFSTKRNSIITISSLFVLILTFYYYFVYYQPSQFAKRIFNEEIGMKLIDKEIFELDGVKEGITFTQYRIDEKSQKLLLAKDSLAWYNTSYCKINDETAKYVEQKCVYWNFETRKNADYYRKIKDWDIHNQPAIFFMKTIAGTNVSSMCTEAIKNKSKAEMVRDLIYSHFNNPHTLYLLTCYIADEGFLTNYKLYILSADRKTLMSISKRDSNYFFSDTCR